MKDGKPLRSQAWFGSADRDGFIHRSWMKNRGLPEGAFDGIIGNAHFRGQADRSADLDFLVGCRGADVPCESH